MVSMGYHTATNTNSTSPGIILHTYYAYGRDDGGSAELNHQAVRPIADNCETLPAGVNHAFYNSGSHDAIPKK